MRIDVSGGIGDVIAATAAVREYKLQHPDEIVRIGNSSLPEIWDHNPYLNVGKTENGLRAGLRMDLGRSDKGGNAAHAHAAQLGIQIVDDCPELWLTEEERSVQKFEKLVLDDEKNATDLKSISAIVERPAKTVAIDVAAGWLSKKWPQERWAALCRRLLDSGWDVLEVGRGFDQGEARRGPIPSTRSYLDMTTVREVGVLISRCAYFLGHDSGLMHLAAAVGTPQVIVYGHTKPADYAYYNSISVFPYSSCGENCYQQCYREPKVRGRFSHCIDEISVDRVFAAVELAERRFPYTPVGGRQETRIGVPRGQVLQTRPLCHKCGVPA